MKCKLIFILLIVLSLNNSCHPDRRKSGIPEEKIYLQMFKDGIRNGSTAPTFIVFTAINKGNNSKKEICCGADKISNLSTSEYNIAIHNATILLSDKGYRSIGADKYDYHIVDSLLRAIKPSVIDSIYNEHLRTGYSKLLEAYSSKYSNEYFEHILFKHRILTFRDCESGFTVIKKKY